MTKEVKRKEGQLGRLPKYPWDKWLSYKRQFKLIRWVDFECEVYSMCIHFRNTARQRGFIAHITPEGNTLLITVEKRLDA